MTAAFSKASHYSVTKKTSWILTGNADNQCVKYILKFILKPEENKKLLTRFTNTHTNTHKAMINYSVYMMSNPMDKCAAAKALVSKGTESSEPCSPHCRLRPSSSRLHSSIIIFTELHENKIESHRTYILRNNTQHFAFGELPSARPPQCLRSISNIQHLTLWD